ncbi:HDIG domain-containing protein [soil metagenome]
MISKFWIRITNRHDLVYKYFLILITIVLIVIALPKQTQFNYSFRVGKPWVYESLMAPFDFAIGKSETELNDERAEVLNAMHPFYKFVNGVAAQRLAAFKNELEAVFRQEIENAGKNKNDIAKIQARQKNLEDAGTNILNEIYARGIILTNTENFPDDGVISIVRNNISEDYNINSLFTIKSAIDFINEKLDGNKQAKLVLASLLENALAHNILYDDQSTRQWTKQMLENVSPTRGMVQNGEVIVLKGQVVDEVIQRKLESFQQEMRNQEFTGSARWMLLLGHFILVSLAMTMLLLFLYLFRKEFYLDNSRIMLLMLLMLLVTYLFLWARKIDLIDMYLVPVCILPIVVRAFYDSRTALFTHVITLLIIGFEAPSGFEFMFIQTIAGMVATFSIFSMNRRSQFFISAVLIFASYTISFVGVTIIHEANFKTIDWMNLKWFAGNAIITLFAFPLIFVFEKAFGFLSDVSLMELCDSNSSLLRELAFKAPGTFQHSLQVANLAEAATFKIGGNPLMARAGAMYHDIGKIEMPGYFIENLTSQKNPHDNLPFEESARIIKSHVVKGIEKARKNKIPEPIIDFIRTHHGTTRLQYFYQSFLKNYPDKIPDEQQFRYPGPLPFSKETTVLMMADSVEASSRALQHPDEKSISELIEKIIGGQIEQQQLVNCPVTLKDISDIKVIFKKMLMSIYHVRVEYPE